MVKKIIRVKKLIVKRKGGFIKSVENPNAKKTKTIYLVQRREFTGFVPVDNKGRKIVNVARGKTEETAIKNVLNKGYRKVEFRD